MDSYKIFRQLEEREKRKKLYKFYDKDELIDTIIELEDNIEDLQSKIDKALEELNVYAPNEDKLCEVIDNAINILQSKDKGEDK